MVFTLKLIPICTSLLWDALGYATIPAAITLADPCGLISFHQIITITADIDCPRSYSSSIIADHTTSNKWAVHKSSVSTSWWVCWPTFMKKVCFVASCITEIITAYPYFFNQMLQLPVPKVWGYHSQMGSDKHRFDIWLSRIAAMWISNSKY